MSLEPEGGPWSVYPLEDGDELLDAHNDILLKFSVDVEPKTKRAIAAAPELLRLLRIAYDDFRELGFCTVSQEIDELLTKIEGRKQKDNVQES